MDEKRIVNGEQEKNNRPPRKGRNPKTGGKVEVPAKYVPHFTYQGKILDGGNRFNACHAAGVEPTFKEFDGKDIGY